MEKEDQKDAQGGCEREEKKQSRRGPRVVREAGSRVVRVASQQRHHAVTALPKREKRKGPTWHGVFQLTMECGASRRLWGRIFFFLAGLIIIYVCNCAKKGGRGMRREGLLNNCRLFLGVCALTACRLAGFAGGLASLGVMGREGCTRH